MTELKIGDKVRLTTEGTVTGFSAAPSHADAVQIDIQQATPGSVYRLYTPLSTVEFISRPPSNGWELFQTWPIGQRFTWGVDSNDTRVKVNQTQYTKTTSGEAQIIDARTRLIIERIENLAAW